MAVKRLFISTGEVSGDLQGSLLVEALRRQAQARNLSLEIVALGGDRMAAAGARLIGNTTAIGSMGLLESLPYLWPTLQLQRRTKQFLRDNLPDAAVMIDYMGPNIIFGNYLRRQSQTLPILFYIAPQEWVWSLGQGNTTQIVRFANEILAIFPGEARYYRERGAQVTYVGHPLLDRLGEVPSRAAARAQLGIPEDQVAIALLPASRAQEIKYLVPAIFAAAQRLQADNPQVHFWIPLALKNYRSALAQAIQDYGLRATLLEDTHQWAIAAADLAITKSGTANLEIALQNVPQVVVYRLSALTAWIARHILRFSIPFMSPPNLINFEPVVPELLQEAVTGDRIYQEAKALLEPTRRAEVLAGYERMRQSMGEPGACDRAATLILDRLMAADAEQG